MARTRCPFTQEAMTRLLKAAAAAGVPVRIEILVDKVVVVPNDETEVAAEQQPERGGEIIL